MNSTGVHWIPVYEILEQHGFEVIPVNARYAKERARGAKPMSAMPRGCASFIPMAGYAAASGLMPRSQPCARICAVSANLSAPFAFE
uniref:hypothetical protein n=1 Tax=Bradyrhizobium altum TaxID=1571202 RepID=UPI001E5746CE